MWLLYLQACVLKSMAIPFEFRRGRNQPFWYNVDAHDLSRLAIPRSPDLDTCIKIKIVNDLMPSTLRICR